MIEIIGPALNQWDTGRSVKITGIEADKVHFANMGDSKAPIMDLEDSQAKIPDYLLQTGKQLCVYAVKDGITVESKIFYVKKRERPEDYVYEDDQRNYIYELLADMKATAEDAKTAAASATLAAEQAIQIAASANEAAENANSAAAGANLAAENANKAADKVSHTAKNLMVIGSARGNSIHLDDAIEQFFVGMRIFGKTTQNGTPTPETPVELVSVGGGGSVGVAVAGKNMLPYPYANTSKVVNGITFTDNGDGSITIDGTASAATYFYLNNNKLCGDTVINAMNSPNGATDGKYVVSNRLFYNGANGVLSINILSGTVINKETIYPQVEIGTSATAYERYKGKTLTISTPNGLLGIPVSSGGNYTDANGQQWICDEIDLTRGVYVQRVGVFTADGTEKWVLSDTANVFGYTKLSSMTYTNIGYCSHFINKSSAASTLKNGAYTLRVAGAVYIRHDMYSTVNEFSTWLSEQYNAGTPVVIYYHLATPVETPLSEEELAVYAALRTYRENTTVSNDASAYMELEYVMDAKKYIDSQISAGILEATVE